MAFEKNKPLKKESSTYDILRHIAAKGPRGATNNDFHGDMQGVYNDIEVLVKKGYVRTKMVVDVPRFGNKRKRRLYFITAEGSRFMGR